MSVEFVRVNYYDKIRYLNDLMTDAFAYRLGKNLMYIRLCDCSEPF